MHTKDVCGAPHGIHWTQQSRRKLLTFSNVISHWSLSISLTTLANLHYNDFGFSLARGLIRISGAAKTKPSAFGHRTTTTSGSQKPFYRTATHVPFEMSPGRGTANCWRRPASMQRQRFGTRNPVNSSAVRRSKVTKTRWNVCHGHGRAICWPPVAEISRCGFGRWWATMNSNVRPY